MGTSIFYNLTVTGRLTAGAFTLNDSLSVGSTLSVTGLSTFGGNVVPSTTNTKTLGTSSLLWNNVYATTFTGTTFTGTTFTGALTGNADTATAFSSSRTIQLTGNVTGSTDSDGTPGWSIAPTIPASTITNAMLANSTVTIGTTTISLGGSSLTLAGLTSVTATQFSLSSLRSLKQDIKDFTSNATTLINSVDIVGFRYKSSPDTPKVGFIADDTDSIFSTPSHNTMDIGNCIGVLLKSIQEINKRLTRIENIVG